MSLLALQRAFRGHLTDQAAADITPWLGNAAAAGLAVYHHAYRVQLGDCLAETFATVHAWLGSEAFAAAARSHIEATPPTGWTLGVYGAGFDRTLAARYPDDPEVAELATLEWQLARAFEGADADALAADVIATVDWDRAGVAFVPSLRLTPSRTNAGAIWSALAAGTAPPAAASLPQPGMLLVWRRHFTPCFRTVETIEHEAITLLAAGARFTDLCAMLVDRRGEADGITLAGTLLGRWFADGLIARVVTDMIRPRG